MSLVYRIVNGSRACGALSQEKFKNQSDFIKEFTEVIVVSSKNREQIWYGTEFMRCKDHN